ncbi:MAG TPA: DUF2796 domain-containing protein [Hyphomonas sp.]|nr:hypothetical protein [Hyphomonas sp.]HRI99575.1 DUF2796 domain-containing protein [Hyphomonas sp.]HRK68159.1 DUF2796 domain-containing protein [Hyphomonas sp.]
MLLSRTSVLALVASAGLAVLSACGASDTPAQQPAPVEEPEVQAETAEEEHTEDADAHEGETEAEDHDHDHDHEASGAGVAHVHGVGDLALSWEGSKLTGELISPLANFGLSEAEGVISDAVLAELPGLVMITGGNCVAEPPVAKVDKSSGHTDAHVDLAWNCAAPSGVSSVTFSGFTAFSSFERVNAIYLTDAVQKAGELSPSSPSLSLK